MASWTDVENEYLRSNYHDTDNEILADYLGRTVFAVERRAFILKLRKSGSKTKKETWPQHDIKFLSDNYGKLSVIEIAKELNRSRSCVFAKLEFLGLHDVKRQSRGKHFRNCLTAEQSERMAVFLKMLVDAKMVDIVANKPANIDLIQLRESYRVKLG